MAKLKDYRKSQQRRRSAQPVTRTADKQSKQFNEQLKPQAPAKAPRYTRARFNTTDSNVERLDALMEHDSGQQETQRLRELFFIKPSREELEQEDNHLQERWAKLDYLMQKDAQHYILADFSDLIGGLRHAIKREAGGYALNNVMPVLLGDNKKVADWDLLEALYNAAKHLSPPNPSTTYEHLQQVVDSCVVEAQELFFHLGTPGTKSYRKIDVKPFFADLLAWARKHDVDAVRTDH